jgi:predicted Rdx family selenoprotein
MYVSITKSSGREPTGVGSPDIKELKQLARDRIAPEMDLGHTDRGS